MAVEIRIDTYHFSYIFPSGADLLQCTMQTYDNLAVRITAIHANSIDNPLDRLLSILVSEESVKFVSLWKIKLRANYISLISRVGYNPSPLSDPTEYFCPIKATHVDIVLKNTNVETLDNTKIFKFSDVSILPPDANFNTAERIRSLHLSQWWAIPISIDIANRSEPVFLLSIYFNNSTDYINESIVLAIVNKVSSLYTAIIQYNKLRINNFFNEKPFSVSYGIMNLCQDVCDELLPLYINCRQRTIFLNQNVNGYALRGLSPLNPIEGDAMTKTALDAVKWFARNTGPSYSMGYPGEQINPIAKLYETAVQSWLVNPIRTRVRADEDAGAIIILNRENDFLSRSQYPYPLLDCFDWEDQIYASEISKNIGLVKDLLDHESERTALNTTLGHELQMPLLYIRDTSMRIERAISRKLSYKSYLKMHTELENITHVSEFSIMMVDSILIGQKNFDLPNLEKYMPSSIEVHNTLLRLKKLCYPLCENRGVSYKNILIDVRMPPLFFDHKAFASIFLNVMTNAIKYSRYTSDSFRDFSLKITCKYHAIDSIDFNHEVQSRCNTFIPKELGNKGFYIFSISDSGAGIPAGEEEKIFNKYHRVSMGTNEHNQAGSGIGLYIVRKLVGDHFGSVWVSNLSSPTLFKIALPGFLAFPAYAVSEAWTKR